MAEPNEIAPAETGDRRWDLLRRVNLRDWYVPGLIAGFIAFCLGPSLVGLRTLISVNALTQFYPWAAAGSDVTGHEQCTGDTYDAGMPGIAYVRSQLFSGHLGSWQNIAIGGGPMGSVPNLGLLDPLSLPYFVLPLWLAPAFVKLLEIVVAIGGTFLFLRRLDVSRPAATLAGFIFVTSGFMVMWTNWPQTRVAAFIPALFWAVERLIQRRRIGDALLIAVIVASMLFGGFPAVTGWALYFVAAYLIVRLVATHTRLRDAAAGIGLAAGGLVLGGMLTMVQMLPFLSQYQTLDLEYRSTAGHVGLPFTGLMTLVVPDAYGLCIAGGAPTHSRFNAIELVAYVGAAALVLAVAGAAAGLIRGRTNIRGVWSYFVAATALVTILIFVSPPLRKVFATLPVFSNNPLGRLRSILGFLLAILAGAGFDALLRSRERSSGQQRVRRISWGVLTWTAVGIGGLILLWRVHRGAVAGHYLNGLERRMAIPGLMVIAAVVVVVAVAARVVVLMKTHRVTAPTVAYLVLPVIVVAQGASYFHSVLPGDDPDNFYPKTPAHQFLRAKLGADRFDGASLAMYTPTALYYGLRSTTGHGFHEQEWRDLLRQADPGVMRSPTFSQFTSATNQDTLGKTPVLDHLAVKYFVLPPVGLGGTFQLLRDGDGTVSVANGASTSCVLPAQALRGVTFKFAAPLSAANLQRGVTVNLTARAGDQTISSGRFLSTGVGAGKLVSIALPGEDLAGSRPITITLSATGAAAPMVLAANGTAPVCAAVNPRSDNLRLVHADAGSIIYQRLTALPRIRWAAASTVIADPGKQLAALKQGIPANEVVLDSPGAAASGRPAIVSVRSDRGGSIVADVSAQGSGYLVVADAMQLPGWSVSVDGTDTELIPADHAMVAVAVPKGTHRIAFHYRAPGQLAGAAISGVALLILIAVFGWELRRRHKPGRVERAPASEPDLTLAGTHDVPSHPLGLR